MLVLPPAWWSIGSLQTRRSRRRRAPDEQRHADAGGRRAAAALGSAGRMPRLLAGEFSGKSSWRSVYLVVAGVVGSTYTWLLSTRRVAGPPTPKSTAVAVLLGWLAAGERWTSR